jgi:hypothetical protein
MACEECDARVARMVTHVEEINGLRKAEKQEIRDLTERIEYLHKKLEDLTVWEKAPGAPAFEDLMNRFLFRYGREDLARFLAARVAKQVRDVLHHAKRDAFEVEFIAVDAVDCDDAAACQAFQDRIQLGKGLTKHYTFNMGTQQQRRFVVGCAVAAYRD